MAERKIDSSLEGIIINYLKKAKCEKTLKLFEERLVEKRVDINTSKKFWNHLKRKEDEKEIAKDYLGFEINFEAYQPQAEKIQFTSKRTPDSSAKKSSAGLRKRNEKSEKKERVDIPKQFIEKIKELGLKVENAEVLYKSKIDWTAVYSNNKIYCPEFTCDYYTKIDNGELTDHLINVRKYGQYACEEAHCNYIGYSKKNLNLHMRMHKKREEGTAVLKCPKPNCQSSFGNQWKFDTHLRIHDNNLEKCQYCPFRYAYENNYAAHLRKHFGITDYKCDQCDKEFNSEPQLKSHYALHEGIIRSCLICNEYEAKRIETIAKHLKRKHPGIVGNMTRWVDIQHFTRTK